MKVLIGARCVRSEVGIITENEALEICTPAVMAIDCSRGLVSGMIRGELERAMRILSDCNPGNYGENRALMVKTEPAAEWECAEPSEATVAKLNLPEFELDFAVITAYPHSVKFSPMLSDRKGVVVEKTPDIIFLKPSHPCYDPDRSPNNIFGKLVSWLADKSIMYDTAQLANYADTIDYLITRT